MMVAHKKRSVENVIPNRIHFRGMHAVSEISNASQTVFNTKLYPALLTQYLSYAPHSRVIDFFFLDSSIWNVLK